jgi:hypothetical protein
LYLKPLTLTSILLLTIIATGLCEAYAIPPLPHTFYGTAKIDGQDMPVGSTIVAKLKGTDLELGRTSITQDYPGKYSLAAKGDDPDTPDKDGAVDGDAIEFYAQGPNSNLWLKVAEATFKSGSDTQLNIEARDTEAPTITLNPPTAETQQTLRGTYSDAFIKSIEVKVNGVSVGLAEISAGAWSKSIQLTYGSNTIEVTARDYSGNTRTLTTTITVAPPTPPPTPPPPAPPTPPTPSAAELEALPPAQRAQKLLEMGAEEAARRVEEMKLDKAVEAIALMNATAAASILNIVNTTRLAEVLTALPLNHSAQLTLQLKLEKSAEAIAAANATDAAKLVEKAAAINITRTAQILDITITINVTHVAKVAEQLATETLLNLLIEISKLPSTPEKAAKLIDAVSLSKAAEVVKALIGLNRLQTLAQILAYVSTPRLNDIFKQLTSAERLTTLPYLDASTLARLKHIKASLTLDRVEVQPGSSVKVSVVLSATQLIPEGAVAFNVPPAFKTKALSVEGLPGAVSRVGGRLLLNKSAAQPSYSAASVTFDLVAPLNASVSVGQVISVAVSVDVPDFAVSFDTPTTISITVVKPTVRSIFSALDSYFDKASSEYTEGRVPTKRDIFNLLDFYFRGRVD